MDVISSWADWSANNTGTVTIIAVVVGGALLLRLLGSRAGSVQKDPTRMFSAAQRATGFRRAAFRCELESFLWFRCKRPAQHGDHWFPHSKGGASSMTNFVAACSSCNLAKSAKTPTRGQTARVQRRRRAYFPAGVDPTAGEWFRLRR